MARKGRLRLRSLRDLVAAAHPELDGTEAIAAGLVLVNGRAVTNPASRVGGDARLSLRAPDAPLRGEAKLAAALEIFRVGPRDRVALDLGAAAGGFTRVLVRAGARRVYAVHAGYGQLLGSLRQHPVVVNLERTNLGELGPALVPEPVDVVTADLSYLPLAQALPQLEGRVTFAAGAELALVKPQFELGLARPPREPGRLAEAVDRAAAGVERSGRRIAGTNESPVRGSRGAVEFLLHARRPARTCRAARMP